VLVGVVLGEQAPIGLAHGLPVGADRDLERAIPAFDLRLAGRLAVTMMPAARTRLLERSLPRFLGLVGDVPRTPTSLGPDRVGDLLGGLLVELGVHASALADLLVEGERAGK